MSFKISIMLMIFTKIVLNPNIYLRRIVLLKILSPQKKKKNTESSKLCTLYLSLCICMFLFSKLFNNYCVEL